MTKNRMRKLISIRSVVAGLALITAGTACSSGDVTPDDGAAPPPVTPAIPDVPAIAAPSTGPVTLTSADLDGFEKGIVRETELVRAAADMASRATTPQQRGAAIQAGFEQATMPTAASATGLSAERYRVVREALGELLTTLDFQGKIDGPQSVDAARAGPAMKARLESDPYARFDAASTAAIKARLSRIVPLWVGYISLTAVGG